MVSANEGEEIILKVNKCLRGASGVMVINMKNGIGEPDSNFG